MVFAACLLSIAIGFPLGLIAYLFPKTRAIILRVVDLLQTIPSLALLGIIMVFIGPGKMTVIVGITLYSLLPIVRNTYLGFSEVDPGIKEAAQGMGMTKLYQTMVVEFPSAFPTIFTGIRIAVVNAIGTAVFAAFVGGGGLGSIINRGIRTQNMGLVMAGTGALMIIAVVADVLMGIFEDSIRKAHRITRKIWIPTVCVLAVIFVALLPFGVTTVSDDELLMYDGDYSERKIMARMAKYLIEDQTDLTVTIMDEMTHINNFKCLRGDNHTCDFMFSYDGSLLTTFLGLDPVDVPDDMTLYDFVNEVAEDEYQIHLLDKVGLDNTYAIAVTQEVHDKYGVEKVSDLVPIAGDLVFGAEHAFFTLEGSMKYGPFCEFYGLDFKDSVSVDVSLKYTAAMNGSFDVTEVYATDGLNRQANLYVLEDDLHFFPDYYGAYLVRDDIEERFPDYPIFDILNELSGQVSDDDMVTMTYLTDVEGADLDQVSRDFLVERGFLTE